jgi:hypothetical protein
MLDGSSVGDEHLPYKQEVVGSNPTRPTFVHHCGACGTEILTQRRGIRKFCNSCYNPPCISCGKSITLGKSLCCKCKANTPEQIKIKSARLVGRPNPHTERSKESLRVAMRKVVLEGRHNLRAGRAKVVEHLTWMGTKEFVQGSWEKIFAEYLDERKVVWTRGKGFPYQWEGRLHQYFPDFHVSELGFYVEVKGVTTPRDRAKWIQFPHPLLIVTKPEIDLLTIRRG